MDIQTCVEEQKNEIEVLKSIYYDEFLEIEPDNVGHYGVIIRPEEGIFSFTLPQEEKYIREFWNLYLIVRCPESYPQTLPELELTLTHPLEGTLPDLDFSDPLCPTEELLDRLNTLVQEELQTHHTPGLVVVFTIVTSLQEHMQSLLKAILDEERAKETARILQEEEKEAAKFYGTPVTRQTFLTWQKKYLLENPLISSHAHIDGKLTGRQLFEQDKTLITSDSGLLGDDDECVDPMRFSKTDLDYLDTLAHQDEDESSEITKMLLQSGI